MDLLNWVSKESYWLAIGIQERDIGMQISGLAEILANPDYKAVRDQFFTGGVNYARGEYGECNSCCRRALENAIRIRCEIPMDKTWKTEEYLKKDFKEKMSNNDIYSLSFGLWRFLSERGSHTPMPDNIEALIGYRLTAAILRLIFLK